MSTEDRLGSLIAVGRTAEIFAWGEGAVLKLFRDPYPPSVAEYEWRVARIVHTAGLAASAPLDFVQVNGRVGIVYERLDGPSMLDMIKTHIWCMRALAHQMAEMHVAMHDQIVPDLPSYKDRLARSLLEATSLDNNLRSRALQRLRELPDGNRLCHGDFHPGNILMTHRGPVTIDWITAVRGHPIADIARTVLLLRVGRPLDTLGRAIFAIARRFFEAAYVQHYFALRPDGRHLLAAWLPVIAAARVREAIPGEDVVVLAMAKALQ